MEISVGKLDLVFRSVFNNKILFLAIFNEVRLIHRRRRTKAISWSQVLHSAKTLMSYNYLETFKSCEYFPFHRHVEPYISRVVANPKFIMHLLEVYSYSWPMDLAFRAASIPCFDSVKLIAGNKQQDLVSALNVAVNNGFIEIVKYICTVMGRVKMLRAAQTALVAAAKKGHIDILIYLYLNARKLQVEEEEYSGYSNFRLDVAKIIESAATNENFDIVKYLVDDSKGSDTPTEFTPQTFCLLAKYGQLSLIQEMDMASESLPKSDAADYAAGANQMHVLRWIIDNKRGKCTSKAIEKAATRGHIDMMNYLNEICDGGEWSKSVMDLAAGCNQMAIIKWLQENRTEGCSANAINKAASKGFFEMVKFLAENRTEGCSPQALNQAASMGHYELAVYLYTMYPSQCNTASALVSAAKRGHVEITQYLLPTVQKMLPYSRDVLRVDNDEINRLIFIGGRMDFNPSSSDIDELAANGALNSLRLAIEMKPHKFTGSAVTKAIQNNQLEALKLIRNNLPSLKIFKNIWILAVRTRDIDMINYVFSLSGQEIEEISDAELKDAAQESLKYKDVLEILIKKYAHRLAIHQFQLTSEIVDVDIHYMMDIYRRGVKALSSNSITHAASYGRLDLVKILYESRALFTNSDDIKEDTLMSSLSYLPIFKYLYSNCPSTYNFENILNTAASRGELPIVRILHENHPSNFFSTKTMDLAAISGNIHLVRFLHANRTEGCTVMAMNRAARDGNFEIVQFLHENRTEGCTIEAMDDASVYGHVKILKFLHGNRTEGYSKKATTVYSSLAREWILANLVRK